MSIVSPEIYPFSTQEGVAIPFDIAEVLGTIEEALVTAATSLVILPSGTNILTCIANEDAWLSFGATVPTISQSTFLSNVVFIPQHALVTLKVPEGLASISVKKAGADDGTIRIQVIRTWKGLKQQTFAQ